MKPSALQKDRAIQPGGHSRLWGDSRVCNLCSDVQSFILPISPFPSENGGAITQDMIHQATLPVKYAVFIFVNAYVTASIWGQNSPTPS